MTQSFEQHTPENLWRVRTEGLGYIITDPATLVPEGILIDGGFNGHFPVTDKDLIDVTGPFCSNEAILKEYAKTETLARELRERMKGVDTQLLTPSTFEDIIDANRQKMVLDYEQRAEKSFKVAEAFQDRLFAVLHPQDNEPGLAGQFFGAIAVHDGRTSRLEAIVRGKSGEVGMFPAGSHAVSLCVKLDSDTFPHGEILRR